MCRSKKIVTLPALLCALIVLMFGACTYDYGQGGIAEDFDEFKPDITMDDASFTVVRGATVTMHAESIEVYSKRHIQIMNEVRFEERDRKGLVRTYGSVKYASIETDTKNATLVGKFLAHSKKDDATIQTKYVKWLDKERRIEGSPTEEVIVTRGDGSKITGKGFTADARARTLTMKGSVTGQLVVDENDDEDVK